MFVNQKIRDLESSIEYLLQRCGRLSDTNADLTNKMLDLAKKVGLQWEIQPKREGWEKIEKS